MDLEKKLTVKSISGESVISIIIGIYTIYYLFTVRDMPWEGKMYSIFIACTLFSLIAFSLIKRSKAKRVVQNKDDIEETKIFSVKNITLTTIIIVTAFIYVFFISHTGYILPTLGFIFFSIVIQNVIKKTPGYVRLSSAIVYSILFSLGAFIIFICIFGVNLPQGYLGQLIQGIIK